MERRRRVAPAPATGNGRPVKVTKKKEFLGSEDTLNLALAIGENQEKVATAKQESRASRAMTSAKDKKGSANVKPHSDRKNKVKETKAILVAKKTQARREKIKKRKEALKPSGAPKESSREPKKPAQKSVSFA